MFRTNGPIKDLKYDPNKSLEENYSLFRGCFVRGVEGSEISEKENSKFIKEFESRRLLKGLSEEDKYKDILINRMHHKHISDFGIAFVDWIYKDYKDVLNELYDSSNINLYDKSSDYKEYYEESVVPIIIDTDNNNNDRQIISVAAHNVPNDPYLNALIHTNQVPLGARQIVRVQEDQNQSDDDKPIPFHFNFTRTNFNSPEEVLNHAFGLNENIQMQEPMYYDQYGNPVYRMF